MPVPHLSASYSITLRLSLRDVPGMFAKVATAIGKAGGNLGSVDLVSAQNGVKIRDVVVLASDEEHARRIAASLQRLSGVDVIKASDRTFLVHLGGKIEVVPRQPVKSRDDLSMIYTPGVGRVCMAIAKDRSLAWNLTMKKNMVAVVSDGTAVLGLGDIGPEGALPVMEGKAILFKAFAGVDAFPLCLDTKDPDEIVETVVRLAPNFGGINLEDISAPRCFEIERRLRERLDIPVMHDDQHGTAVVVLAALTNALRLAKLPFAKARVVVSGAGASGMAVSDTLLRAGIRDLVACDRAGALWDGRADNMNADKAAFAKRSNPRRVRGPLRDALKGAHVFVGLSGPGTVKSAWLRRMAKRPILFLLANPTPECPPEEVQSFARIVATGRSDYPNQINNALAFPGIFRGALDVRAKGISEKMKLAAARAIAKCVAPRELSPDYIIPSIFNPAVAPAVAGAVSRAAYESGMARRRRLPMGEDGLSLPALTARARRMS